MDKLATQLILDPYSIVFLLSGVFNLVIFVFLRLNRSTSGNKDRANLSWAILAVSVWMFSSWFNHFIQIGEINTLLIRISFTACVVAAFQLLSFARYWQKKTVTLLELLFAITLSLVTLLTPLVIAEGVPATISKLEYALWGNGYAIWSFMVGILILLVLNEFRKAYASSIGAYREKIKFVILLFTFIIVTICVFNLLLPNFGVTDFIFIGQFSTIAFAAGTSWIVLQDQIYSIKYILANIGGLISSGIVLFLISWGTQKFEQYVLKWDISQLIDPRVFILGIFVATFVAGFVGKLLPSLTEKYFKLFKVPASSLAEIREWLIDVSNSTVDINAYIYLFLAKLGSVLNTNHIYYLIPLHNQYWKSDGAEEYGLDELKSYAGTNTIIINNEHNHKFALIIPLVIDKEAIAFLFIGSKINTGYYSLEEINALKNLLKILTLATNRHILYKDQKLFTETLEKRISEATKQLSEKVEALEEVSRRERDMLDILGHELRTPLTIVKNAIILLRNLVKQPELELNKITEYVDRAYENVDRESKLLETMLSTTKIDNQRLELQLEKVDMIDVVNDSFDGLREFATKKGLEIWFNKDAEVYSYLDRQRIQEVADNLISNAIKYTNSGHVEVKLENLQDNVVMYVSDSGEGISEEDLARIGHKFYRAKTYVNDGDTTGMPVVRAGGTGLGLYVTFSLVKLMNGNISVTSKVGEGTTFRLELPLYTGQEPKGIKQLSVAERFEELKNEKNIA